MARYERMVILSGNANRPLAEAISRQVKRPLADALVSHFRDGESRVLLRDDVRGADVFIVQPTSPPVNHNVMELLVMIDAAKRASAGRITAVIPYYGYAKQEKKTSGREPISAKLVANLITTAGANRVLAIDLHAPAIEAARANAEAAGVGDRIRFEVRDVGEGIPGEYDLITCFDVVHDMPFPRQALPQIRAALAPGGSFFVLEFNFSDELRANIDHPFGLGSFGYGASVNYCMTTALAAGGEGTGTCMGERRLRALAAEAGFSEVRRLDFPQNPLNLIFEIKA